MYRGEVERESSEERIPREHSENPRRRWGTATGVAKHGNTKILVIFSFRLNWIVEIETRGLSSIIQLKREVKIITIMEQHVKLKACQNKDLFDTHRGKYKIHLREIKYS